MTTGTAKESNRRIREHATTARYAMVQPFEEATWLRTTRTSQVSQCSHCALTARSLRSRSSAPTAVSRCSRCAFVALSQRQEATTRRQEPRRKVTVEYTNTQQQRVSQWCNHLKKPLGFERLALHSYRRALAAHLQRVPCALAAALSQRSHNALAALSLRFHSARKPQHDDRNRKGK